MTFLNSNYKSQIGGGIWEDDILLPVSSAYQVEITPRVKIILF